MRASDIQKAIYDVMTSDPALVAMLSGAWGVVAVFSDVPQQNADDPSYYPFVSFGPDVTTPFDTKTSDGGVSAMQINVWSRSGDYIEVKDIAKRIWELLHRVDYPILGASLITSDVESVSFSIDPDGETRRGFIQLSVKYDNI